MNEEERGKACKELASNLAALRKSCGFSQGQFAERIGVSRSTVYGVERKKDMTWNVFLASMAVFSRHPEAKKIIGALDIDIDEVEEYLSAN